ncbi:MAG: hypothetical protein RLZZ337_1706 [Bacteroidota bacterium]
MNIQRHYMKPIGNLFWAICTLLSLQTTAQTKNAFYIQFNSKGTQFRASENLSQAAIDRRMKYAISYDSTDYPVNQDYISTILKDTNISFRYSLKWHNAIVVESDLETLEQVRTHSFVKKVAFVGKTLPKQTSNEIPFTTPTLKLKESEITTLNLTPENYGVAYDQNKQIGVIELHQNGFDGNNVKVAVFDAGFFNIHKLPSFIKQQGNGLLTYAYDVVDLDVTMNDKDNHGTAVSSCIAAYDINKYVGSAPNASLFLFRTENAISEYPLEELNWCKAAELADSAGMDLITSSLGYNQYDDASLSYTWNDLNGRTSYVSLAAKLAVDKGIFVLNSAGNEGDKKWRKIGTPADVPAVLTIGAVDVKDRIGSFSSQGYNAEGKVKPDVCALGVKASVASTYGSYYQGYGTSYATPIAAGGVACLLQAFPNVRPKQVAQIIRETASQGSTPDSLMGYGIARLNLAYEVLKQRELENTTPYLMRTDKNEIVIFTSQNATIDYELFSKRSFLWIFKRKAQLASGQFQTNGAIGIINISELNIKCSKKYTLKVELSGNVENLTLKYNDLSLCSD